MAKRFFFIVFLILAVGLALRIWTCLQADKARNGLVARVVAIGGRASVRKTRSTPLSDLAGSLHLVNNVALDELDLSNNDKITDELCEVLGRSTDVRSISLRDSSISDSSLRLLAKSPKLEKLDLWGTNISDDGVDGIGRLTHLKELNLCATKVTDKTLIAISGLTELEHINAGETLVTDKGAIALDPLQNLTHIVFEDTRITDEGLEHLGMHHKLSFLGVTNTDVSVAAVSALEHRRPNVLILGLNRRTRSRGGDSEDAATSPTNEGRTPDKR